MMYGDLRESHNDGNGLSTVHVGRIRVIYRCPRKSCRKAERATYEQTFRRRVEIRGKHLVTTQYEYDFQPLDDDGAPAGDPIIATKYLARRTCADCSAELGRSVYMDNAIIEGKNSRNAVCTVKCKTAIGPQCDCSCEGEMHGSAYSLLKGLRLRDPDAIAAVREAFHADS